MKLLVINSVSKNGSTGKISYNVAKSFAQQNNNQSLLAYGRNFLPNEPMLLRIGNSFSVYFHKIMNIFTDRHGFYSKIATKKLIKKITEYNPDIVWLNNIHGYYLNIYLLFKWLKENEKNIKVFWTLHDCWAFTGHCAHFISVGCEKWKSGCYDCPRKHAYPFSLVSRCSSNYIYKKNLFTSLNRIVFVSPSKWLASCFEKSFLNNYPIKIINNGINLNDFYYEQNNLKYEFGIKDKKVILCVAPFWVSGKGIFDILELNKIIEDNYVIVLVGEIKEKIDIPKNIICLGSVKNVDLLRKVYSFSDVFFNPTHFDTYSNTNMEALACDTPVVCYKSGGAYEMIDEEYVVKKGNIFEAYSKIKKIVNDPKSYKFPDISKMSYEIFIKKYIDLFSEEI